MSLGRMRVKVSPLEVKSYHMHVHRESGEEGGRASTCEERWLRLGLEARPALLLVALSTLAPESATFRRPKTRSRELGAIWATVPTMG